MNANIAVQEIAEYPHTHSDDAHARTPTGRQIGTAVDVSCLGRAQGLVGAVRPFSDVVCGVFKVHVGVCQIGLSVVA